MMLPTKCPVCKGKKVVSRKMGEDFIPVPCPVCADDISVNKPRCPTCHGMKVVFDEKTQQNKTCPCSLTEEAQNVRILLED